MRKPNILVLALCLCACTSTLQSQVLQQLPTHYLEPGDLFGTSAAISGNGNYIVVGAPAHRNFEDPAFQKEGVAFVYALGSGWMIQDTLHNAAFLEDDDKMGAAVAINTDGTFAAVGSPGAGNNRGDVRLFKRNGSAWTMLPPLLHTGGGGNSTGASPNDFFGSVVALDGSGYYLAAGSPLHHHSEGRANVCWYDAANWLPGWGSYASFSNPEPDMGDGFGAAISIDLSANYLVIGAPGEDNGIGGSNNTTDFYGAVYFYKRNPSTQNTWTLVQKIKPSSLQAQSYFGASLDLNKTGDSLIVGAPGQNGSGAAFLFTRTGDLWSETDVVSAYNPEAEDDFGLSVALTGNGDIAIVGTPLRDTASVADAGAAYLFRYANPSVEWTQYKALALPPGYEPGEAFGYSVAIASSQFRGVITSPYRGDLRGAAFVFTEAALPVTWLSFRATLEGSSVHLSWSTASEAINEGFAVQRSANGRDWQTIHFEEGAGTTSEVQHYSYIDLSPFTLHASLIYYRLEQRDTDGATDYSPVRVVELGAEGGIRVFPNPASEVVTVAFGEVIRVRGTLRLLNGNGRLVAEHTIPVGTTDYQLRVAQLPSGTYLLEVKVGNQEWTKRLVVE